MDKKEQNEHKAMPRNRCIFLTLHTVQGCSHQSWHIQETFKHSKPIPKGDDNRSIPSLQMCLNG